MSSAVSRAGAALLTAHAAATSWAAALVTLLYLASLLDTVHIKILLAHTAVSPETLGTLETMLNQAVTALGGGCIAYLLVTERFRRTMVRKRATQVAQRETMFASWSAAGFWGMVGLKALFAAGLSHAGTVLGGDAVVLLDIVAAGGFFAKLYYGYGHVRRSA